MHVMNLLWQLYASRLCARSVPDHVTSLLHTHLAQAPWPAFLPTLDNLQAFNKVERIKAKLVLEKSGLTPINGCVMYSNNLSIPRFIIPRETEGYGVERVRLSVCLSVRLSVPP